MAIHTQRWVCDTCSNPAAKDACTFLETWDDSVDPVARTHDFSQAEHLCTFHAALTGPLAFLACYDENRRKNVSWKLALSVKATLILSQMVWSYDANHLLTLNFGSNLTNAQKNSLQNAADVQFGPNKVLVV